MPLREKSENFYYSYDIKDTHFVSVNSEIPFKKQFTPEYILEFTTWLENDLKSTQRKWKIIYLHRPLYCSKSKSEDDETSFKEVRKLYEDIIFKYKVDLVLTGHTHAYDRMFPIYKSVIDSASLRDDQNLYYNPKYAAHVVCGTGGLDDNPTECIFIVFIF